MEQGNVDFSEVKYLILDEADRMLDIGFYDDIMRIIKTLPEVRQSLMFSATMAPKIRNLAKEILKNPEEVSVAISKPAEGVTQQIYLAFEEQKIGLAQHLLKDKDGFNSILIFCSTKKKVEQLTRKLLSFLLARARLEDGEGYYSEIAVPMTRADIADYLGLTVETVSRTFTTLREDGLIRTPTPNHIVLTDCDRIEDIAGAY